MKSSKILITGLLMIGACTLTACGTNVITPNIDLPPVGINASDGSVVHGRAV